MAVSACGGGVLVSDGGTVPEVDLYEIAIADAPDPADRAGAASGYVDCTYGISNGGWSLDFGPPPVASDPEGALVAFLSQGWFGLPNEGYTLEGTDIDRALFTYSADGRPKVAVIVASSEAVGLDEPSDGWIVETFATCDPAEFSPSADDEISLGVWHDAEGKRIPTSIITTLRGAEHCGWQSVTYLTYRDRTYVSDPYGVMDVPFVGVFDDDTDLPTDAVDAGYHLDGRELWLSIDGSIAYLVIGDRVESWPAPEDPDSIWCS